MIANQQEIVSAALALPPAQRAEIAERLLESLDGPEQQSIQDEWACEIERRIERLERGETQPIPAARVLA